MEDSADRRKAFLPVAPNSAHLMHSLRNPHGNSSPLNVGPAIQISVPVLRTVKGQVSYPSSFRPPCQVTSAMRRAMIRPRVRKTMGSPTEENSAAALAAHLPAAPKHKFARWNIGHSQSKELSSGSYGFLIGNETLSQFRVSHRKQRLGSVSNREEFSFFTPASDSPEIIGHQYVLSRLFGNTLCLTPVHSFCTIRRRG